MKPGLGLLRAEGLGLGLRRGVPGAELAAVESFERLFESAWSSLPPKSECGREDEREGGRAQDMSSDLRFSTVFMVGTVGAEYRLSVYPGRDACGASFVATGEAMPAMFPCRGAKVSVLAHSEGKQLTYGAEHKTTEDASAAPGCLGPRAGRLVLDTERLAQSLDLVQGLAEDALLLAGLKSRTRRFPRRIRS